VPFFIIKRKIVVSHMNKKYLILTILLVVAAITRLIPHPLNFAPIGAMALASGAYFGRNLWAFLAPLCIYWFSDLLVNNLLYSEFYNSFVLFTPGFGWLYISFAAIVLLGSLVFSKITLPRILGGALGASIIFFIVSNFGVWLSDPDYPLTVEGLILCYEMAIPFFRSTISGDLIYSGVLFGLMEWSRSSSMAWGWGSSAA
jgi:hypothetical protein